MSSRGRSYSRERILQALGTLKKKEKVPYSQRSLGKERLPRKEKKSALCSPIEEESSFTTKRGKGNLSEEEKALESNAKKKEGLLEGGPSWRR